MITLTARIQILGDSTSAIATTADNSNLFILGQSKLGYGAVLGYLELYVDINSQNLISISRSIFDRSDLKLPSYGIISNVGEIEFNDTDGKILEYANNLMLQKGLRCEIYLNNTLVEGAKELIGVFETDQWEYDSDNRLVRVTIKDDLEEWQDIYVEGISYDPTKPSAKNFATLYKDLFDVTYTTHNYKIQGFEELEEKTRTIFNKTYMKYYMLESGSLWQQWQKLCEACQMHIYKDNTGKIVCRYNGGN